MAKKVGFIQIFQAIKKRLETTGIKVLDYVPDDEKSPFYLVEFVGREDDSTKTTYRETISVWIHAIAEPSDSREGIFDLQEKLENAMTENIDLGDCITIVDQNPNGIYNSQKDPSGEWHVTMGYDIRMIYGYKMKV